MPQAFYHAGYLVGSIGTIVIGSIAVYCIQMLLTAHYELCKRRKVLKTFSIVIWWRISDFVFIGAQYGLSKYCQKCITRRSPMDPQICKRNCVMLKLSNDITSIEWNNCEHFVFDRHVTNFFILIYQLGICCIYIVFIAQNIKSMVDHFTGYVIDVRLFMVIILLPIILINWVSAWRWTYLTDGTYSTIFEF